MITMDFLMSNTCYNKYDAVLSPLRYKARDVPLKALLLRPRMYRSGPGGGAAHMERH